MLTIQNFRKKYSDKTILSIPEVSFSPGVYWIRGENGSGKSTLFKCIAGICPHEGSITIDHSITISSSQKDYLQRVSYGEAEPAYPGFLTAQDLFRFVGSARNATETQMTFYRRYFDIDDYYLKPIGTCSSGMIKRISLALMFLGNPTVLLFDEPLVTLDLESQNRIMNLISNKAQEKNKLIFISSHQELDAVTDVSASYVIGEQMLHKQ
jgi:ABC-2 type transport system ATP-binding protein